MWMHGTEQCQPWSALFWFRKCGRLAQNVQPFTLILLRLYLSAVCSSFCQTFVFPSLSSWKIKMHLKDKKHPIGQLSLSLWMKTTTTRLTKTNQKIFCSSKMLHQTSERKFISRDMSSFLENGSLFHELFLCDWLRPPSSVGTGLSSPLLPMNTHGCWRAAALVTPSASVLVCSSNLPSRARSLTLTLARLLLVAVQLTVTKPKWILDSAVSKWRSGLLVTNDH